MDAQHDEFPRPETFTPGHYIQWKNAPPKRLLRRKTAAEDPVWPGWWLADGSGLTDTVWTKGEWVYLGELDLAGSVHMSVTIDFDIDPEMIDPADVAERIRLLVTRQDLRWMIGSADVYVAEHCTNPAVDE